MSFKTFGLHADLVRGTDELGFTAPTPIQSDAIPPALLGNDVLACAMTGSGKTAAFGLPLLHHLHGQPRGKTRALVLSPTRELAVQTTDHLRELGRFTRIGVATIMGGVPMRPQMDAFRRGVDILVATPGRLLDHLQSTDAHLDDVNVLILDEADRMLDMGFLPDIRRVLRYVPRERQTLFFSATMPHEIVRLSREMLKNPVSIDVERPSAPATGVSQTVFQVQGDKKSSLLLHLLQEGRVQRAIAFTRTKHRADRLDSFLCRQGIKSARIHGNRSQSQRTAALDGFRDGHYQVLVATDIAARGIDVDDVTHVVNYDVPNIPDDYIHRVGRTARASATGDAFTFASPEEAKELRAIERAIGKALPREVVEGLSEAPRPEPRPTVGRRPMLAPAARTVASKVRTFRRRW